jgi:hypothetical protein
MTRRLNCRADYILRLRTNCFAVYDENGNKIRVVQKLQFLNNNRLKTAKNADFVKNMHFLEDL